MIYVRNVIIAKTTDTRFIKELTHYIQTYLNEEAFVFKNTEIRYTGFIGNDLSSRKNKLDVLFIQEAAKTIFKRLYGTYELTTHHHRYLITISDKNELFDMLKYQIYDPYIPTKSNTYFVTPKDLNTFYKHYNEGGT